MLNRLIRWRNSEAETDGHPPSIPPDPEPGTRLYCVGDIHGCLDRLIALHALILADAAAATASRLVLVYLGDYIDRGGQSREVIDLLIGGPLAGFEIIHLMGNHEDAMLTFLAEPGAGIQWLSFGGLATLDSYGVPGFDEWPPMPNELARTAAALAAALPSAHLEFLNALKPSHVEGDLFMVHAGIRPRVALDHQKTEDLFWIRDPFLNSEVWHGKLVIHGHTITKEPEIRSNRIGIDTGAYRGGRLTCAVFQAGEERRFLQS